EQRVAGLDDVRAPAGGAGKPPAARVSVGVDDAAGILAVLEGRALVVHVDVRVRSTGLSVAGCVYRVHWVQVGAWSPDACRRARSRICLQASRLHAPTCTQCTRCTQPATDRPVVPASAFAGASM